MDLKLGSDLVFNASLVPLTSHTVKEVSKPENRSVPGLGFAEMLTQHLPIAVCGVPVIVTA